MTNVLEVAQQFSIPLMHRKNEPILATTLKTKASDDHILHGLIVWDMNELYYYSPFGIGFDTNSSSILL